MDSVQKQLEELGLSSNEVKVYTASLEIGAATAQQLAAKAAVVRPTAYVAIGGLVKRGLMSSHTRGKKQFFQAEHPAQLLRLMEEEKKRFVEREFKLKSLLPGLESLIAIAGEKPEVKYYEGIEGLQAMHQVLYESKAKSIDVIGNPKEFIRLVPETLRVMHILKMRKLAIKGREIYFSNRNFKQHYVADNNIWKYKSWKGNYSDINSEIAVFGDFVTILTYESQVRGILIRSSSAAKLVKMLFEAAWYSR
jgi:sugar-specific transcriptional regulator TrmB